jgi:integration host factor subunit beta
VALTKLDLSESVLEALNTTRRESGQIVEIVLASMVRALRAGDKVEIRGFGTFHTRA